MDFCSYSCPSCLPLNTLPKYLQNNSKASKQFKKNILPKSQRDLRNCIKFFDDLSHDSLLELYRSGAITKAETTLKTTKDARVYRLSPTIKSAIKSCRSLSRIARTDINQTIPPYKKKEYWDCHAALTLAKDEIAQYLHAERART